MQHIKHLTTYCAILSLLALHCFSIYMRITWIILHTAIINAPNNNVPKWYLKHQQNALHVSNPPLLSFLEKNHIDTARALIIWPIATINAPAQKNTNIWPSIDYLNSLFNVNVLAIPPGAFGTLKLSTVPAERVYIANIEKIPVTIAAAINWKNGSTIKPHNDPNACALILITFVATLIRLQLHNTYNSYINRKNAHAQSEANYIFSVVPQHPKSSNGNLVLSTQSVLLL